MEEEHPELKYEPNYKFKNPYYYDGYPKKLDMSWHREELMKYKKIKELYNRKLNEVCNFQMIEMDQADKSKKSKLFCQQKLTSILAKKDHLRDVHGKYMCIKCGGVWKSRKICK